MAKCLPIGWRSFLSNLVLCTIPGSALAQPSLAPATLFWKLATLLAVNSPLLSSCLALCSCPSPCFPMEALKEAQEDSCIDKHAQYSRGYRGSHREPVFLCLVTKWTSKEVNHIFCAAAGLQINLLKKLWVAPWQAYPRM